MTRHARPIKGNRPWTTACDAILWRAMDRGEDAATIQSAHLPTRRVAEIAERMCTLRHDGKIDPPTKYRYELPAHLLYVRPDPTPEETRARVNPGWYTNDYALLAGEGDE